MKNNDNPELQALFRAIEDQAIDKSEWLPRKVMREFFTRFEGNKNFLREGVQEYNGYYTCATAFAFDELYRWPVNEPIFNSSQLSAAEFFHTLYEVAMRRSGYGRLNFLLAQIQGTGTDLPTGFCPLTLLKIIAEQIGEPWKYALCKRICLNPLRTSDRHWVANQAHNIQQAFDALGASIEISIDILKKRLENERNYEGRTAP